MTPSSVRYLDEYGSPLTDEQAAERHAANNRRNKSADEGHTAFRQLVADQNAALPPAPKPMFPTFWETERGKFLSATINGFRTERGEGAQFAEREKAIADMKESLQVAETEAIFEADATLPKQRLAVTKAEAQLAADKERNYSLPRYITMMEARIQREHGEYLAALQPQIIAAGRKVAQEMADKLAELAALNCRAETITNEFRHHCLADYIEIVWPGISFASDVAHTTPLTRWLSRATAFWGITTPNPVQPDRFSKRAVGLHAMQLDDVATHATQEFKATAYSALRHGATRLIQQVSGLLGSRA